MHGEMLLCMCGKDASREMTDLATLTACPAAMPRYYICDKKLASLGWVEKTSWEEGLAKTINWYLEHGFGSWWMGDVDAALAAHPKAQ
jgi:dTDP-D-glucose 4,6-dehydratase